MLTLLIGFIVGIICGFLVELWLGSIAWAIVAATLGFIATSLLISLWVKKRMEAIFNEVQLLVEANQEQLRRKVNLLQNKNVSGGKGLQRQLEKEQAEGIRKVIPQLDRVQPLFKWNMLAKKQVNTVKAQFYYQIQEFAKADEYFKSAFIMDPLTQCMRMARLYKQDRMDEVEKLYKKGVKRFKDEQATMIYALYTWILVKENKIDEAVAILNEGREATENEVLRQNWEHLANNRVRRFSNAGLGDQWFALHLEKPKPVKVRQQRGGRFR